MQADEISASLSRLGFDFNIIPATLDLESLKQKLLQYNDCVVFNLVESIDGNDRMANMVPALLDSLYMNYTGSKTGAITVAGDKITAKRLMLQRGIPTAPFFSLHEIDSADFPEGKYIIKSVFDHASAGITADSVIDIPNRINNALKKKIEKIAGRYGSECFAEKYVDGREFNVSVLAGRKGPEVLPVAEICFVNFPKGKARILDYKAKWNTDTDEYKKTVRTFGTLDKDERLAGLLKEYSLKCWELFNLGGYARVDFRVDENGNPWVLEVNANPCLSSDAGFMAAAAQKGYSGDEVIRRIVESAG